VFLKGRVPFCSVWNPYSFFTDPDQDQVYQNEYGSRSRSNDIFFPEEKKKKYLV
jgi:hypothetical protein